MKLLQELNPDVEGDWAPSVPEDGDYTIIMYSTPVDDEALQLAEFLATAYKVPLISMHSAGFYSYFRIKYNTNFAIVDTHPESTATTDLRLLSPWPELVNFVKELTGGNADTKAEDGLSSLSNLEHGHIPYLVLLLYYLEEWKKTHGAVPEKYSDKIAFRKMVAGGARTDTPEGGEENFDEAVAAVLKTISAPTLSGSVREVFEYKPNEVCSPILISTPSI
jgi:amyloid beta precursor protein binding protein 1